MIVLPPFRNKRAVNYIIVKFREMNALDEKSARTLEELGIRLTSITPTSTFFGGGDPIHSAVNALREAGVIIPTGDGKFYLSEAKLSRSKWASQETRK